MEQVLRAIRTRAHTHPPPHADQKEGQGRGWVDKQAYK